MGKKAKKNNNKGNKPKGPVTNKHVARWEAAHNLEATPPPPSYEPPSPGLSPVLVKANEDSLLPTFFSDVVSAASDPGAAPLLSVTERPPQAPPPPPDDSWMDDLSACAVSKPSAAQSSNPPPPPPPPPACPATPTTYAISYHSTPLTLCTADKCAIYELFLTNMKALYLKSHAGLDEPEKVGELFSVTESRYLVVRSSATQKIVAFTHFRFCYDFDDEDSDDDDDDDGGVKAQECAYVYEIQVAPGIRCGLGRRMMEVRSAHSLIFPPITLNLLICYTPLSSAR